MVKLYVNTDIQSIDREITDIFAKYICQTVEESNIILVSRKTVLPDDIERLTQNNRKVILLVDSSDRDLIRAAKQAGVKDMFFSPVKIDSIEKKINEIIEEMQTTTKANTYASEQTEPKQEEDQRLNSLKTFNTSIQDDSLDELLACIKAQVSGSEELEALRRENMELKMKLKRYQDFVAVLTEIFRPQNKGVEKE